MTQLAQAFPWLITLLLLGLVVLAIRLGKTRSQGAASAGPVVRPEATVPGLKTTAWDLVSIEETLNSDPGLALSNLRQIARTNGIELPPPVMNSRSAIDQTLDVLEKELGIT